MNMSKSCPSLSVPFFGSKDWLKENYLDYFWFSNDQLWMPVGIKKQAIWYYAEIPMAPRHLDGSLPSMEEEKSFLTEVIEQLKVNKVDFIRQPPTHVHFQSIPKGAISCPFGSYQVDLKLTEEELWSKVHQKHRNVIRKAEKDGVQIEFGHHLLPDCLELLKQTLTMRSQVGMHADSWFTKMTDTFSKEFLCGVAYFEGKAHGSVFMPWNQEACYYLYGGSSEKPHGGAMNLLHWKAMLLMKSKGVKIYDFVGARINPPEGSKYEGIQRFKERFGAHLSQGFLWKLPINPIKMKLYEWALRFKGVKTDIITQENLRMEQKGK